MSDCRKKSSGSANRKRAAEKSQKVEYILSKTPKLESFFNKSKENENISSNIDLSPKSFNSDGK